jgi:hypothetical protein
LRYAQTFVVIAVALLAPLSFATYAYVTMLTEESR